MGHSYLHASDWRFPSVQANPAWQNKPQHYRGHSIPCPQWLQWWYLPVLHSWRISKTSVGPRRESCSSNTTVVVPSCTARAPGWDGCWYLSSLSETPLGALMLFCQVLNGVWQRSGTARAEEQWERLENTAEPPWNRSPGRPNTGRFGEWYTAATGHQPHPLFPFSLGMSTEDGMGPSRLRSWALRPGSAAHLPAPAGTSPSFQETILGQLQGLPLSPPSPRPAQEHWRISLCHPAVWPWGFRTRGQEKSTENTRSAKRRLGTRVLCCFIMSHVVLSHPSGTVDVAASTHFIWFQFSAFPLTVWGHNPEQ